MSAAGQIQPRAVPKKGLPCAIVRVVDDAAGRPWQVYVTKPDRVTVVRPDEWRDGPHPKVWFVNDDAALEWVRSFDGVIMGDLGVSTG